MHESLKAEGAVGQVQMAMEHGAGLQVVEVVLVVREAKRGRGAPI